MAPQSCPLAEEGIKILPIPPALEFPFPRPSGETFDTPRIAPFAHHSSVLETSNGAEYAYELSIAHKKIAPVVTPSLEEVASAPQPAQKRRLMTERPMPAQRASQLRMRRNQTGYQPTELSTAAGPPHSDDTSSSDDDGSHNLTSVSSHLSGRSLGLRQAHRNSMPDADTRDRQYRDFSVGNDNYKTKG